MTGPLPLVIEPDPQRGCYGGVDGVVAWLADHHAVLDARLLAHGAVLLRGFDVRCKDDFARVARTVMPTLSAYTGGNSPRTDLGDHIYTSTEYPPQLDLPLHNELACSNRWPATLMFFCRIAPVEGGQTPLVDGRRLLRTLPASLRRMFERERITYCRKLRTRHHPGPGKPWQVAFETDDRREVEAACARSGASVEWSADGSLRTRVCRQAVIAHPRTGELTWFNQVVLFHPSSVPAVARRFSPEDPRDSHLYCCFEDGTPIDDAIVDELRSHIARCESATPWQQGDVLVIDNLLVAHGRRAFRGPREILLAMAGDAAGGVNA